MIKIRSGIGYDIHRIVKGSGLMLGGIKISTAWKFEAHSDGDVLIHAIIDALLGAMGLPDIGELFPDTDPKYRDISSLILLQQVEKILNERHFEILNLDCIVLSENIRISAHKEKMIEHISNALKISSEKCNIKGKSKEKMDAVGRGEAIECFSIAMIRYNQ